MQPPILSNIIDAVAIIPEPSIQGYLTLLRDKIGPAIRRMEANNQIIWYSFLIHDRESADRDDLPPEFSGPFVHLRLGLPSGVDADAFLNSVPEPLQHPIGRHLGSIGGVDSTLIAEDWSKAWWMVGEASDWVLKLLETHPTDQGLPAAQMLQFLHYITNGLGIGMQSVYLGPVNLRF
jgi:hypothetical protein